MSKLELKGLSVEDLNAELDKTEEHYHSLRFNNAVSNLENTAELKLVRRNIARIKTAITAIELADSTQPRDKIKARRKLAKKIKK
jgi:large subunit ribosomal protein L29